MVLEVIKSHVKNRGVGYSSKASLRCDIPALKAKKSGLRFWSFNASCAFRSPRTCIFTSRGLNVLHFECLGFLLPLICCFAKSISTTGSKRYGLQLADRIYLIGPTGLIQEAIDVGTWCQGYHCSRVRCHRRPSYSCAVPA